MAAIFLSHSSRDKDVARQLAGDLKQLGHQVWLDEWNIRVGQCIPTEIEQGIATADFVTLLLSKHAVESSWVDREWKMAYWDEINSGSIVVLPVLLEKCEIPKLLQTKKYANLAQSYAVGFRELADAIDWYCEQQGLTTSYESSTLVLPRIIRGSKDLVGLTLTQLHAKAPRLVGQPIAIQNAHVLTIYGSTQEAPKYGNRRWVEFCLADADGDFGKCLVTEDTPLEELILQRPTGTFYGVVEAVRRFTYGPEEHCFLVSEFEPQAGDS